MPRKLDSQTGLWDRTVEMPELEEALETIDAHRLPDYIRKRVNKANRVARELTTALDLKDGERVRVGRYVVTGKTRAGGGFEVPAWERTVINDFEDAPGD